MLYDGFAHLAAGLACGLAGLAAGMAIGIVGDAGVRSVGIAVPSFSEAEGQIVAGLCHVFGSERCHALGVTGVPATASHAGLMPSNPSCSLA